MSNSLSCIVVYRYIDLYTLKHSMISYDTCNLPYHTQSLYHTIYFMMDLLRYRDIENKSTLLYIL